MFLRKLILILVFIVLFMQYFTFSIIDSAKRKSSDKNWQSIQFLSSFYYVIREFYTLKVEHHWIESIQRIRLLHKKFIAILAWDHCKKSHINIQGYYKFLLYKLTKRYLYYDIKYYTLNWHKSFLDQISHHE